jgi:hypothetical protein
MISLQDLGYIGSFVSGLAGLVALSIAVFQLNGLQKSVKHSNLMAIFGIEFELNRRKERLASIRQENLQRINGRDANHLTFEEKELIQSFDSYAKEAYEDYLNVFDRLSYFILKGNFNEEDFRLEYRDMLFDTIESDEEEVFGTGSRYRNMKKLYDLWKEK